MDYKLARNMLERYATSPVLLKCNKEDKADKPETVVNALLPFAMVAMKPWCQRSNGKWYGCGNITAHERTDKPESPILTKPIDSLYDLYLKGLARSRRYPVGNSSLVLSSWHHRKKNKGWRVYVYKVHDGTWDGDDLPGLDDGEPLFDQAILVLRGLMPFQIFLDMLTEATDNKQLIDFRRRVGG